MADLIKLLGDVKARVQDKLGIVDFPMPQFILIGKQSVGKSRLIESLAGETFNFISGTLGSRRPTVLEFRNVASHPKSRWYVRDRKTNQWGEHDVATVMKIVGDAHEELGESTSEEPVYVRLESPDSVDMSIVDLPGFRDFAMDAGKQLLAEKIQVMVEKFMHDKRNVMLCVEQASDAATMSTLARCRRIDPKFERTILIRNKLDKYYTDLTSDNVNKWIDGYGDLPQELDRFAVTLPWWQDGTAPPSDFAQLRAQKDNEDVKAMQSRGISAKYLKMIGFSNF
jgi:GTP-binding protein EngB required for normal cell division